MLFGNMSPPTKMSMYQKLLTGSPITSNSRISTPSLESPNLTEKASTTVPFRKFGITSIITEYISTGQKLLNQVKKVLRKKVIRKMKMKKKITRTLVNLEVIQPRSTSYYNLQKYQLPPPYRKSPVDQEPQHNKQVRFLESPETHHQS